MSDLKNIENLIERHLEDIEPAGRDKMNERIISACLSIIKTKRSQQPASSGMGMWRMIMKSRLSQFAAVAVVICAILSIAILERFNQTAWAIEQTIEALKNYKGIYASGTIIINGGTETGFEMWARANSNGMTEQLLAKLGEGSIIQVKNNMTYYYIRQANTVYVDDATTAGFSMIFGPQFYELVEKAPEFKTDYGRDPATGRKVVVLTTNYVDVSGAQSWIIELDVESKLPVSMKQWDNFNRMGKPNCHAQKMLYFDDLPDSAFETEIPQDAKYAERPLTIPEENIALLSHPKYGISAENKSQEQASKEIVEKLYKAVIAGDISTIRELCPLADTFSDEFLRHVCLDIGKDNPTTELVEIGNICKRGNSKLGPIVAVPVVFRTKDGKLWDEKMIVQFRQTAGKSSCVIYGPYGFPAEKKSL